MAWGATCFTNAWNPEQIPIIDGAPLVQMPTNFAHSSSLSAKKSSNVLKTSSPQIELVQRTDNPLSLSRLSCTEHIQSTVHKRKHLSIHPTEAQSRGLLSLLQLHVPKCPRSTPRFGFTQLCPKVII